MMSVGLLISGRSETSNWIPCWGGAFIYSYESCLVAHEAKILDLSDKNAIAHDL